METTWPTKSKILPCPSEKTLPALVFYPLKALKKHTDVWALRHTASESPGKGTTKLCVIYSFKIILTQPVLQSAFGDPCTKRPPETGTNISNCPQCPQQQFSINLST